MPRKVYEIELTPSAARSFRNLERPVQVRIAHALDALTIDPRPTGVVKLSGDGDFYRIRVGDYRIIYSIEDKLLIVLVIAIGHRRDVYRR